MAKQKINPKAAEYCRSINDDGAVFVEIAVRRLSQPFDESELKRLADAGYDKTDGDYSVFKDGEVVTKVQMEIDTCVFVQLGPSKTIVAHPTLDPLVRPKHVTDFIAALTKQPDNGWGKTGDSGLMYRGHNVFDVYVSKDFNDAVMEIIQDDEELRQRRACDECVREMELKERSSKLEGCRKMTEMIRKCAAENLIPKEEITAQEVYLGYVVEHDMFISGWDVWGSDTTGSVLIAFKIREDGKVLRHDDTDGYRGMEDIYDASNRKFYEQPKTDAEIRTPMGKRSFFENVTMNGRPDWTVMNIRLD